MLGLSSAIAIPTVYADTTTQQIQQANENIKRVNKELSQLERHIMRIEEAMRDNSNMIAKNEKEIKMTEAQVKQLEKDIQELNKSIEKRKELLAKRAVALQEAGGKVDYLEVLFGAESFGDFVNRAYAVSQIASADKDLIEQFEKDKKSLEDKKSSVTKKLAELKDMKAELDEIRTVIQHQKQESEQLRAQLTKEKQENINKRNQLQASQIQSQVKNTSSSNNNSSTGNSGNSGSSQSAPASSNKNKAVEIVIQAGYKYIGNSVYVYGGGRTQYDIQNGRFDCSGFVHWAFSQAGYNVGTTTQQLARQGTRVSVQNMKPGDLVFFDTVRRDGHVGIYIGNGKFIGSQTSTGVAIADMSSGYWAKVFNGRVNRIIK